MACASKNAIERRLDRLHDQWAAFAGDPDARLLRWVLEPDERRVVDTFLLLEAGEHGEVPDLFVRIEEPFDAPEGYGRRVAEVLLAQHDEARPALIEAGIGPARVRPTHGGSAGARDATALFAAAGALRAGYADLVRHVALVLVPARISSARAWAGWLERAVAQADDPHVRVLALDLRAAAALATLAEAEPRRVRTATPALDMPRAYEEISDAAGRLDTPAGRFRHVHVRLGNAIAAGDRAAAERHGAEALRLAEAEGWMALAAAVHLALGAGDLAAGRPLDAARRYRRAEGAARAATARGEAPGKGLELTARLAMGAALIAAGAFGEAARAYEESAPLARELGDTRTLLECWRMAAYGHEGARSVDAAWRCGVAALGVGRGMDAETRRTSTLPQAGEALLRLSRTWRYRDQRPVIEREMRALLGPDGRPASAREAAP
jgi:hypothetical protein